MLINAKSMDYSQLNSLVKETHEDVKIENCLGQRFIGSGSENKNIDIYGVPGNALGAYLNGGEIRVFGNAQDAVGDTMNDGKIIVHGNIGDACGYAMRGGEIYIKGNAGYRAGIHMKAYAEKLPVMVIGGSCGSFLGEYQAGGLIVVLGLNNPQNIVGYFCGTGMHGGKIFLRTDTLKAKFPPQVAINVATDEDKKEIEKYIENFCDYFDEDKGELLKSDFYVLTPNSTNPFKQLYVRN